MPKIPYVDIQPLDQEAIREILRRNHVGRIAYCYQNRVDIEPIHYVFDDDWIWARTSPGTKLAVVQRNWWVAFEVDEIDALFEWRSVVVHGGVYIIPDDGTEQDREVYRRAVELLRTLVPDALTERDPTPDRTVLFRIAIQEASGRRATLKTRTVEAGG